MRQIMLHSPIMTDSAAQPALAQEASAEQPASSQVDDADGTGSESSGDSSSCPGLAESSDDMPVLNGPADDVSSDDSRAEIDLRHFLLLLSLSDLSCQLACQRLVCMRVMRRWRRLVARRRRILAFTANHLAPLAINHLDEIVKSIATFLT
jgi:hypothetical protein